MVLAASTTCGPLIEWDADFPIYIPAVEIQFTLTKMRVLVQQVCTSADPFIFPPLTCQVYATPLIGISPLPLQSGSSDSEVMQHFRTLGKPLIGEKEKQQKTERRRRGQKLLCLKAAHPLRTDQLFKSSFAVLDQKETNNYTKCALETQKKIMNSLT